MKSYMALKAEIARLEKQAESARKAEVADVVRKIKDAIDAYGLTARDLGLHQAPSFDQPVAPEAKAVAAPKPKAKRKAKAASRAAKKQVGVAKYRDPATGKTWTGRGKPPAWIAGSKNRDAFLIAADAPVAAAVVPAKAPAKPPAKAGRKAGRVAKPQAAAKPVRRKKKAARKSAPTPELSPAIQMESTAAQ